MQLEEDARDLDVVARLEARGLQRADDAHPAQAPLDVREGLVVVEVVACEQPHDAVAVDLEDPVVLALDAEAAARRPPPPPAPPPCPGARRRPRGPPRGLSVVRGGGAPSAPTGASAAATSGT